MMYELNQVLPRSKVEAQQRNYSSLDLNRRVARANTNKTTKNTSVSFSSLHFFLFPWLFLTAYASTFHLRGRTTEVSAYVLISLLLLLLDCSFQPMQSQVIFEKFFWSVDHNYNQKLLSANMECQQSTCRGGVSCCQYDSSLGAYCITDTYCNAIPPLWQTIFIPLFLFVATLGMALMVVYKYRHMKPQLFSLADFVERELRLQPMEKNEHTKLKTITSFE